MKIFERKSVFAASLILICLCHSNANADEQALQRNDAITQQRPALAQRFRPQIRRTNTNISKLKKMTWKVGRVTRKALVAFPSVQQESPPLIFVFHGHGGTGAYVARKTALHELWPEAIVIYPHGLPTPVPLIDPEGRWNGWQKSIGDQEDRDLKFFDEMINTMRNDHHIDPKRVFSMGHSNGGFFTYVLWAARGDVLAAVAPIAALNGMKDQYLQKPKPVMHIAGKKDRIVPFQFQLGTIIQLRKLNGCEADGKPFDECRTEYTSATGPPVVAYLHPGGHEIPEDAPGLIVKFFQQCTQKQSEAKSTAGGER